MIIKDINNYTERNNPLKDSMGKNIDPLPLFKIIILGDSCVGKTALTLQVADNEFNECFITTIGVDFRLLKYEINGNKINVQIWDTCSQERFRSIISSYYRNCSGVILVYDITSIDSFNNIEAWTEDIMTHCDIHCIGGRDSKDNLHCIGGRDSKDNLHCIGGRDSKDNLHCIGGRDSKDKEYNSICFTEQNISCIGCNSDKNDNEDEKDIYCVITRDGKDIKDDSDTRDVRDIKDDVKDDVMDTRDVRDEKKDDSNGIKDSVLLTGKNLKRISTPIKMIIGNKSDLEDQRQVSTEAGRNLAEKIGADFIETSAKTANNVNEAFYNIVYKIYAAHEHELDLFIKSNKNSIYNGDNTGNSDNQNNCFSSYC